MNLQGLATSRESQFLSKERKIPRTEFSPQLQLIRSSEVDPFAPAPGATPEAWRTGPAKTVGAARVGSGKCYGQGSSVKLTGAEGVDRSQTLPYEAVAWYDAYFDAVREKEKLQDALVALHGKYRAAEVSGAVLLLATLALAVLIAKPDSLDKVKEVEAKQRLAELWNNWEERCHWMFAGGIGTPQRLDVVGGSGAVEPGRGENEHGRAEHGRARMCRVPTRTGGSEVQATPRSFWSRLFWSSPDLF